jgi:hypothetical protein
MMYARALLKFSCQISQTATTIDECLVKGIESCEGGQLVVNFALASKNEVAVLGKWM